MEKLKKVWDFIVSVLAVIFFGFTAIFLFKNDKKDKEIEKAEKAREDKKNELEEKSADDIAADSPNADTISANIEREQEEFRERVRDRLNKKANSKFRITAGSKPAKRSLGPCISHFLIFVLKLLISL